MGSVDEADVEKAEEQERREQWSENVSTAEQPASPEEGKEPAETPLSDSITAENGSGPAAAAENGANVRVSSAALLPQRSSLEQDSGRDVVTRGISERVL